MTLDDDEAIAVAIGLTSASGTAGLGEAATTALLKLEQVMPWRLRGRVNAIRSYAVAAVDDRPVVDPRVVVFLTGACRDHRLVTFDYTTGAARSSRREVEPYRLTETGRRWSLYAYDLSRSDWRSFRLDRMVLRLSEGARFTPRQAPSPASLEASADAYHSAHGAVVLVGAPVGTVRRRLPDQVRIEAVDQDRCRVHATGPTPQAVAFNLLLLDEAFTVEAASADVLAALRTLGRRALAAEDEPGPSG